jgi:hypothetical protein
MKSNICLILIIFCLCLTTFNYNKKLFLDDFNSYGNLSIYATEKIDVPTFASAKKNGKGYIITIPIGLSQNLHISRDKILGESISFKGNIDDFNNILVKKHIKIVKKDEFSSILTIYGYIDDYTSFINLDNEKINIQGVLNNGIITFGCPIILGSY